MFISYRMPYYRLYVNTSLIQSNEQRDMFPTVSLIVIKKT